MSDDRLEVQFGAETWAMPIAGERPKLNVIIGGKPVGQELGENEPRDDGPGAA